MGKILTAFYNAHYVFVIPDTIPLLSQEENDGKKPWSWWIRWNDLYYLDDKLEEHMIEGGNPEVECKHPEEVELTEE